MTSREVIFIQVETVVENTITKNVNQAVKRFDDLYKAKSKCGCRTCESVRKEAMDHAFDEMTSWIDFGRLKSK